MLIPHPPPGNLPQQTQNSLGESLLGGLRPFTSFIALHPTYIYGILLLGGFLNHLFIP